MRTSLFCCVFILLTSFLGCNVTFAKAGKPTKAPNFAMMVGHSKKYDVVYVNVKAGDKVSFETQPAYLKGKSLAFLKKLAILSAPVLFANTRVVTKADQVAGTSKNMGALAISAGAVIIPSSFAKKSVPVEYPTQITVFDTKENVLSSKEINPKHSPLSNSSKLKMTINKNGKIILRIAANSVARLKINGKAYNLNSSTVTNNALGGGDTPIDGPVTDGDCIAIDWFLNTYVDGTLVSSDYVGSTSTCDVGQDRTDGGSSGPSNPRPCPAYLRCDNNLKAIRNNSIESANATFMLATAACLGAGTAAYLKIAALTTGPSFLCGPPGVGCAQVASVITGILIGGGCEILNATVWDNAVKNAKLQYLVDKEADCKCD